MIIIRALISVIHAILRAAAEALLAGFSLLVMAVIILALVVALIAALTGCLGFGGVRWFRNRRNGGGDCD